VLTFAGVVLAGGHSSRMGRDKALVEVDGRALAQIAADALAEAGATEVVVIGGDVVALAALGLYVVPDDHPGDGPLGAIITALGWATEDIVMVLACDMPAIDAATVTAVVSALDDDPASDVAAPRLGDHLQILTAAYRTRARPTLETAFAAGERAPRRALEGVRIAEVDGLDPDRLADVDRPDDLHRYAQPQTKPGAGHPTASPPARGPQ
jgi:molybdopterin-guanine dinucleotide biosynthesis protein A